jgi:hypothetical protein
VPGLFAAVYTSLAVKQAFEAPPNLPKGEAFETLII